jgi:hypothetical protein
MTQIFVQVKSPNALGDLKIRLFFTYKKDNSVFKSYIRYAICIKKPLCLEQLAHTKFLKKL